MLHCCAKNSNLASELTATKTITDRLRVLDASNSFFFVVVENVAAVAQNVAIETAQEKNVYLEGGPLVLRERSKKIKKRRKKRRFVSSC